MGWAMCGFELDCSSGGRRDSTFLHRSANSAAPRRRAVSYCWCAASALIFSIASSRRSSRWRVGSSGDASRNFWRLGTSLRRRPEKKGALCSSPVGIRFFCVRVRWGGEVSGEVLRVFVRTTACSPSGRSCFVGKGEGGAGETPAVSAAFRRAAYPL